MRSSNVGAMLIASLAFIPAAGAGSEQPTGTRAHNVTLPGGGVTNPRVSDLAPRAALPNLGAGRDRAHETNTTSARPKRPDDFRTIEADDAAGHATVKPAASSPSGPTCLVDGPEDSGSTTVDVESAATDAFLLPVWNHVFWGMPPGGLTRYLLLPPQIVDPDEATSSDSLASRR